jgi:hypothetical protein
MQAMAGEAAGGCASRSNRRSWTMPRRKRASINRTATSGSMPGRPLAAQQTQPGQVETPVDASQHMSVRDQLPERAGDEQLRLPTLLATQHLVAPARSTTTAAVRTIPGPVFQQPQVPVPVVEEFARNCHSSTPAPTAVAPAEGGPIVLAGRGLPHDRRRPSARPRRDRAAAADGTPSLAFRAPPASWRVRTTPGRRRPSGTRASKPDRSTWSTRSSTRWTKSASGSQSRMSTGSRQRCLRSGLRKTIAMVDSRRSGIVPERITRPSRRQCYLGGRLRNRLPTHPQQSNHGPVDHGKPLISP